MDDKTFRIVIDSKELQRRLIKRVEYHQTRMKHYMKKEAQELKEKLKKQKETMEKEQAHVAELDLALAQDRHSYRGGFSRVSGFSGASGYSGMASTRGLKFEHTVTIGHSEKFVSHERAARKLQFIAEHLKEGVIELTQYEIDQFELV